MNVIDDKGADPWVVKHGQEYLYCKSTEYDTQISIGVSKSIQGIGAAALKTALSERHFPKDAAEQIWAPELHRFEDKWYVYYAASDGDNSRHRMHIARSVSDDPLGEYEYAGKINTEEDRWAIDGTVLHNGASSYFIWSGWEGDEDGRQNLYIAGMTSPTSVSGDRICISEPTLSWEQNGMSVNEGPAILQHDGDVFVAFSASASWTDDYCIGLMKLVGTNPLDPEAWHKFEQPLYAGTDEEFGPGHCSFTKDENGDDVMVYHTARHSGSGWDRQIRHVPITWEDNHPVIKVFAR